MIDANARGAWRNLEGKLRPFVARRVQSPSDVDDVVQDVFLRMHRSVAQLQDDERFGPWLYQVARSAIADHHRARARHPLAEDAVTDEIEDATGSDAESEAHAAVTSCIAPFVAMLPSPYRQAITLAELEGLTQKAAADMLGISLPAMKSRVQRGRARLREALDACCEIALDARGRVMACEPRACCTGAVCAGTPQSGEAQPLA